MFFLFLVCHESLQQDLMQSGVHTSFLGCVGTLGLCSQKAKLTIRD
jgi:hypothetical protein